MDRIGVYAVAPSELGKPPAARQYEEKGVYDPSTATWDDTTDGRLVLSLPDDDDTPYSVEEIQDAIETATIHVYYEEDVPGDVKRDTPPLRREEISTID